MIEIILCIIGLIILFGIYRITKAMENFVPVQIIEELKKQEEK